MKIVLGSVSCTVDIAANGVEAITKAKSNGYDIIFMDCQMPGMDGLQATREIRADKTSMCQTKPIIALTAKALQGDREKCIQAGMNDYVTKPVKPDIVHDMIKKYVVERKDR